MSLIIKVKKTVPPKPIPEGLYEAYLKDFSENQGKHGPYLKVNFVITDKNYRDVQRNFLCNKTISYSESGKYSDLYLLIKAITGQELVAGEDFNLDGLIGQPCRIFVKNDRVRDGIMYQTVTEVLPPKADEPPEPEPTQDEDKV